MRFLPYSVFIALFAIGLFVVGMRILGYHARSPEETVELRQSEFEKSEPRWDWAEWRRDGRLVCIDRVKQQNGTHEDVLLRECRVAIPYSDGAFGEPRFKLAIFACSPEACAWVLEP